MHILIAEDEALQRRLLEKLLVEQLGYAVTMVENGQEAIEFLMNKAGPDLSLVLSDLSMPIMDGRALLEWVQRNRPELPLIILTANSDVEQAVELIQSGAADFIPKPVQPERLKVSIGNALRISALGREVERLQSGHGAFKQVVGADTGLKKTMKLARRAATSDISVLLTGESGVGKEVIARAIHIESQRGKGPFVAVNCGALPSELVESTLFGHEKGAFTGASQAVKGKFREADGGTLFLDEIGELPSEAQASLLRALQEKEVEPVGSGKPVKVNIRVIAATNRDLSTDIARGNFREDLFHRLNVFPVHIPGLRDRREDIAALAAFFADHYAAMEGVTVPSIDAQTLSWMQHHSWPGNVRELENRIYRAVLLCENNKILPEDIEMEGYHVISDMPSTSTASAASIELYTASGELKDLETIKHEAMMHSVTLHNNNVVKAAEALGIGKSTLYRYCK